MSSDPEYVHGSKVQTAAEAKAKREKLLSDMPLVDRDDPNYIDEGLMREYLEAMDNLPEGWSRRANPKQGEAIYIHVSGKESWKNPNQAEAMKLQKKFDESQKKAAPRYGQAATIQKLRKMLAKGLPEAAVAQRAKIEGVDMALVLATDDGEGTASSNGKRDRPTSFGDDDGSNGDASNASKSNPAITNPADDVSPRLVKKYKNMLKIGISIAAVQQIAHVESNLQPADVLKVCGIEEEGDVAEEPQYAISKTAIAPAATKDPMRKYKAMVKSGVPVGAVQQTALRDGMNPEVIIKELGIAKDDDDDDDKENSKPSHFTPVGDKFIEVTADTDLSKVVTRMAQTVQRAAGNRGRSFQYTKTSASVTKATIRVDMETLYNALGALQGVQWAIDQYNATTDMKGTWDEAKAKRQAYAEMATTLGIALPSTMRAQAGIAGLVDLIDHIKIVYKEQLDAIHTNCQERGLCDFDSLAFLYTPGSRVLAKHAGGGGVDMICQVVWNRYEQGRTIMGQESRYFQVCFQFIVAVSGEHFAISEVVEGIQSFDGTRSISTLNFVPLMAFPSAEQDNLVEQYRRRGEMYNRVATGKPTYMNYDKSSFFIKSGGGGLRQTNSNGSSAAAAMATGGRIMVDTQGAYDYGHSIGCGYETMVTAIKHKYKEYKLHMRTAKKNQDSSGAGSGMAASKSGGGGGSIGASSGMALLEAIPQDCMDLVWPSVMGFSFTSKAWGDVLVDSLSEIKFQDDIFDRLVLPLSRKRIIKALIKNGNTDFQDVIQGKGEGSVFLLYGPPGVGKTLTAEAVCEVLHKPLYSVSLGQLGTTPADLETRLGEILNLCSRWDALILLDEADIFLEKRTSNGSLERNSMVSIMLRLVEYFQGILFLTSNRVDALDPAFQTRITLALRYDHLERPGRAQIWKNLLEKSGYAVQNQAAAAVAAAGGGVARSQSMPQANTGGANFDTYKLADAQLNGREIKNCLRMSLAMAAEEGKQLSESLLLETIETVRELNKEMNASKEYDWEAGDSRAMTKKKSKKGIHKFFSRALGRSSAKE
eukprot:CAMPEP_0119551160 /NCGR_PEP_ID=MMETSP1352-20130426/4488_1 /TAXON_ID=265584 /ORGANISM="Stauroneis constricta, Strain CCMP1120" /LENGTH=1044 /DNA_ID=CAMNT_0007597169 /DNA_START=81 /DNA_END=3215 /DNA_ORIENTATION=+